MARTRGPREAMIIAGQTVASGSRAKLEFPIARLMSGTPVALPVVVLHGVRPGPTIWVSAAIHGDEICGVEIIRRVLAVLDPLVMRGTVLAVPVVNVHGFNAGDRYLPDRRDLNRSFPGTPRGSLASQIANLMMTEIIGRSSVGIDLHTGSDNRINLPQIRADLDDPQTLALAQIFGAPIAMHSKVRDGSLRGSATEQGATVLLYEGGEAGRFDEPALRRGTEGVLRVIDHLGIQKTSRRRRPLPTTLSRKSAWLRASTSGIMQLEVELGTPVKRGDRIAVIHDPYGTRLGQVKARRSGMVIGHAQRPLVNRGDAIVHVAEVPDPPKFHAPSSVPDDFQP